MIMKLFNKLTERQKNIVCWIGIITFPIWIIPVTLVLFMILGIRNIYDTIYDELSH